MKGVSYVSYGARCGVPGVNILIHLEILYSFSSHLLYRLT